jgi:hypothetical protein
MDHPLAYKHSWIKNYMRDVNGGRGKSEFCIKIKCGKKIIFTVAIEMLFLIGKEACTATHFAIFIGDKQSIQFYNQLITAKDFR